MNSVGTNEDYVTEPGSIAMHWRKPLRIDEINRMARTSDVIKREGRA